MVISTSIDDFLNGGLRDGHLIELVGPSSSGKTQVRISYMLKVLQQI